jgi:hypothetical protein
MVVMKQDPDTINPWTVAYILPLCLEPLLMNNMRVLHGISTSSPVSWRRLKRKLCRQLEFVGPAIREAFRKISQAPGESVGSYIGKFEIVRKEADVEEADAKEVFWLGLQDEVREALETKLTIQHPKLMYKANKHKYVTLRKMSASCAMLTPWAR